MHLNLYSLKVTIFFSNQNYGTSLWALWWLYDLSSSISNLVAYGILQTACF